MPDVSESTIKIMYMV